VSCGPGLGLGRSAPLLGGCRAGRGDAGPGVTSCGPRRSKRGRAAGGSDRGVSGDDAVCVSGAGTEPGSSAGAGGGVLETCAACTEPVRASGPRGWGGPRRVRRFPPRPARPLCPLPTIRSPCCWSLYCHNGRVYLRPIEPHVAQYLEYHIAPPLDIMATVRGGDLWHECRGWRASSPRGGGSRGRIAGADRGGASRGVGE
jgi:hypothetical protein